MFLPVKESRVFGQDQRRQEKMGKRKPLRCRRCGAICVEVGHAISYPKRIQYPGTASKGKPSYEYRYVCPDCGTEFIRETLHRRIYKIPKGADFNIGLVNGQEVIQVNAPWILRFWGLSPEKKGVRLTEQEVRKLQARAWRIRESLSRNQLHDDVFVWERFKLTPQEIKILLGRNI